jgi:hypothetical protein
MRTVKAYVRVDDISIAICTDWNDCPVGLFQPQPDWLVESMQDCICRGMSIAPHDQPLFTNYKCKMFADLSLEKMEVICLC